MYHPLLIGYRTNRANGQNTYQFSACVYKGPLRQMYWVNQVPKLSYRAIKIILGNRKNYFSSVNVTILYPNISWLYLGEENSWKVFPFENKTHFGSAALS